MKIIKIDVWDTLLFLLLIGTTIIIYLSPLLRENASISTQFIIKISDMIFPWLIFSLILKKVIQKSEKS